ncbi:MAG: Zn-ribbon domain-containing OB-fold protein [Acidimicrobiia bacterium]
MRFDLPQPDLETQPFWDAARAGRLSIKHCNSCDQHHFYPRPFCPHCWSEDVEWVDASGRATLYTWSVVHRNDLPPFPDRIPYVAAVVDLAEGPRMMTNVVDCEFDALCVGMDLEAVFHPTSDEVTIVQFRPVA